MLQNKLRLLKNKWVKLEFTKKIWIIAIIIAIIIGGIDISQNYEPFIQEENYTEMYAMVDSMIESKTTDVEFDNSKVDKYTVIHNENGEKTVHIDGEWLEELEVQLTSNYQIKSLRRAGYGAIIAFWVFYVVILVGIGVIGALILMGMYAIIKKIFKKE